MSLAVLFELPDDAAKLQAWSFSHAAQHRDIIRVTFERRHKILTEYPLDPLDPNDMGQWLYQHQIMHQQQNTALGLETSDLMGVDWLDRESLLVWLQQHGNEHQQAATILQLG
jgi:hypothetical protein